MFPFSLLKYIHKNSVRVCIYWSIVCRVLQLEMRRGERGVGEVGAEGAETEAEGAETEGAVRGTGGEGEGGGEEEEGGGEVVVIE